MIRFLGLFLALSAAAGWAASAGPPPAEPPAPHAPVTPPAAAPERPAPPPADLADELLKQALQPKAPVLSPKPAAQKPPAAIAELSPEEARRLRLELQAATARLLTDARAFYKIRDWDRCIAKCDEALKRDPGSLEAQKLRYQAESSKTEHRLEMLDHEAKWKDKDAIGDVDQASNFPDKHAPLPRPVRSEKPAPLPLRTPGGPAKTEKMLKMEQLLNQHVDFNMMDVDLEFLLTTLSRVSQVNIIADQSALADKRLTLAVQDMPLKEVLRFIARTKDINYTVTEDAVWISAGNVNPALEPRIHAINTSLVSSTPMQVQQRSGPAAPGGAGAIPMPAAPGGPGGPGGQNQPNQTYLEQAIKWMQDWKEWPSGSKVEIDKMTSSLLVYTTPEMHDKIDEMLETMDRPPIQILISTRFVTVTVDDLRDVGLDFSMNTRPGNKIQVAPGTGYNLGAAGIAGGMAAIVRSTKTDPLFTATLKALETTGRGKLLSAPQIITLNNQPGHIAIDTAFNYVSGWTPVITSDTIGTTGGTQTTQTVTYMVPQVTQQNTGFYLDVTPSVGRDLRHIVLDLIPRIREAEGGTKQFGNIQVLQVQGNTTPPPVVQPIINEKTLTTRLVTSDGDLVVIGGLMGQETSKAVTKVPVLGDIPFLGFFFRHTRDSISKTHLIIVVKAEIIDPTGRTYTDETPEAAVRRNAGEGPWFTYPEPAPAPKAAP